MAELEHLFKSYNVRDLLDDVASADPPAYLRRCFAEGLSTPSLSFARTQQLAGCAMILDAVLNGRDYESLEPELIGDWRVHYGHSFVRLKETAVAALRRALEQLHGPDAEAAADLEELLHRLAPA